MYQRQIDQLPDLLDLIEQRIDLERWRRVEDRCRAAVDRLSPLASAPRDAQLLEAAGVAIACQRTDLLSAREVLHG